MKTAYQIIILQLVLAVLAAGVWLSMAGRAAAFSAIAGGVGSIIPNILFAFQLFAPTKTGMAKQVLKRFYRGVILKIALTAIVFWISIAYFKVTFLPFITTFMLCQLAFWLTPWLSKKNRIVSV